MENFQVFLNHIESYSRQLNDGLTFLLVLKGQVTLQTFGAACTLSDDGIAVINHRELYSVEACGQNLVLLLGISGDYLSSHCPETLKNRYLCSSAMGGAGMESLYTSLKQKVARMAFLCLKGDEEDRLLFQSELFQVLYTLGRHFKSEVFCEEPEQGEAGRLYSVLARINQNYKNPLSLEELAGEAGLSTPYLSKLFKKEVGISFLEYVSSLRLKAALEELIYTDDTITRIAMNSGFSGIKIFNAQFRKRFGCSPARYRREHAIPKGEENGNAGGMMQSPESLEALVRYVSRFDKVQNLEKPRVHVLNVKTAKGERVEIPGKILNIGPVLSGLQSAVRSQMVTAQEAVGFEYVRFSQFFFMEEDAADREMLHYFQCMDLLEFFRKLNLIPFFYLELDALEELNNEDRKKKIRGLRQQLKIVCGRFEEEYLEQWYFELHCSPDRMDILLETASALREICPRFHTGIRYAEGLCPGGDFISRNQFLLLVDFMTYTADPNQEEGIIGKEEFETYHETFHRRKLREIKAWAEENNVILPVYLTEFNTLTGKSRVEAGEFHRTALIADTVLILARKVAGIGFSLNLLAQQNPVPELISYPLSLFLYKNIRRPLFFALRSLMMLEPQVFFFEDNILVTGNGKGSFAILMYHPCYTDPFQSLDNVVGSSSVRDVSLILNHMQKGKYHLKSILLDRDNGSLYNNWLKMNFCNPLEEDDIVEYLENFCNPSIALSEEEIEGTYEIRQTLTLNAISIFLMKLQTP